MATIVDAQRDMREAYYGGAPGILTSGTAWFLAALVAMLVHATAGLLTLVFAGMLIFPISVLFCKVIGCSGRHRKDNPLAPLAIEGTVWMMFCIPIALGLALFRVEWFFPAMLLIIAGRYLTFSTLYGSRLYWLFGGVLAVAGIGLALLDASVSLGALTGAVIEYVFGIIVLGTYRAEQANKVLNS